jgi:hypothetical protein
MKNLIKMCLEAEYKLIEDLQKKHITCLFLNLLRSKIRI